MATFCKWKTGDAVDWHRRCCQRSITWIVKRLTVHLFVLFHINRIFSNYLLKKLCHLPQKGSWLCVHRSSGRYVMLCVIVYLLLYLMKRSAVKHSSILPTDLFFHVDIAFVNFDFKILTRGNISELQKCLELVLPLRTPPLPSKFLGIPWRWLLSEYFFYLGFW